jgi:hypothetical protein
MYLFHRVDAVVFVEGGDSQFRIDEIIDGKYTADSIDILFWRSLFEVFAPGRQFQFRAIGSKQSLSSIAAGISAGSVKRVLVCMDRDFDNVVGTSPPTKGVIRTTGYSWENDVWCSEVVLNILNLLRPSPLSVGTSKAVIQSFKSFLRQVSRPARLDILLHIQHLPTVLRSGNPESFLIVKSSAYPEFNRSRALSVARTILQNRRGKMYICRKYQFDPQLDCYGHLLAAFGYRLVSSVLSKSQGFPSLPKYFAAAHAIAEFCKIVTQLPAAWNHYSAQFAAV